ncbi:MAG: hypothetical protein QMC70_07530, partial [Bacteroidia bacterium]
MQKYCLFIICVFISLTSVAQIVAVGKVVDQQENAVHNVRIQEKGTRNIMFSNAMGEYSLSFFDAETPIV